jgi:anti-anti-sigma factor
VQVSGELDVLTAPRLAAHLDRFVRTGSGSVVADLRETVFMDSAGLYVLLNAQRRLARQSRRFAVVAPPGPVRRVIELSRVQSVLGVVSTPYELSGSPPSN